MNGSQSNIKIFKFISVLLIPLILRPFHVDINHTTPGRTEPYFDYLCAEYHLAASDVKRSISLLESLAKKKLSSSAHLSIEHALIRALSNAEDYQKIATRDNRSFNDDLELQLIFAQAYINSGDEVRADMLLQNLLKKYPTNEQVVYFNSLFLIKKKRFAQALAIIATFLASSTSEPKNALFHFLRAKIYLDMENEEKALAALNDSLKSYSVFDKAWYLKALILHKKNDLDGAIFCYQKLLECSPDNPALRKQLISLLMSLNRFPEAYEQLLCATEETEEYYTEKAMLEWRLHKYNEALGTVNTIFEKKFESPRVKILKVELLLQTSREQDAYAYAKEWLASAPHDPLALKTFIALKSYNFDKNHMVSFLESLIKQAPSRNLMVACGDLHSSAGNFTKACALYEQLLNIITDKNLRCSLLARLGHIYFITNCLEKVEPTLKAALDLKHDDPIACNLLAYYYATVGKNLTQAINCVEKALKNDPTSSAYLDTKGYILLRIGRTQEALTLFKQALLKDPHSEVIHQHLALVE